MIFKPILLPFLLHGGLQRGGNNIKAMKPETSVPLLRSENKMDKNETKLAHLTQRVAVRTSRAETHTAIPVLGSQEHVASASYSLRHVHLTKRDALTVSTAPAPSTWPQAMAVPEQSASCSTGGCSFSSSAYTSFINTDPQQRADLKQPSIVRMVQPCRAVQRRSP